MPSIKITAIQNGAVQNSAEGVVRSGTVQSFATNIVPDGWLLCDGSSFPKSQYPMLFAAIGTRHGGDVNNFNIPDYRGRFLRGTDGGVGRDPDRASRSAMNAGGNTGDNVGSIQGDQFRTHNHAVGQNLQRFDNGGPWDDWSQIVTVGQQNIVTVSTGGNETRPINANVIFCIKI